MTMLFCALHIPDFPAAAVIRAEPGLHDKPVAVLEGTPPLLRVAAMNEGARFAGVEAGMTKLQAEALPDLAVRRRSPAQEAAAHAALLDCAHGVSPRVEPIAPDTVLADVTGLDRLVGDPAKIAHDLARRAAGCALAANVAIAANREAAIHAARGFAGVTIIAPGEEARCLGPLPVDVLFAGPDASRLPKILEEHGFSRAENNARGSAALAAEGRTSPPISRPSRRMPRGYREAPTFDESEAPSQFGSSAVRQSANFLQTLDRWGVHTLRAFAALPTVAVAERLGQEGVRLQKLARGEGSDALIAAEPPLHFEEALELEHPVDLLDPLAFILARLLEQLCARLGSRALSTNELRLALTLDTAVGDDDVSPREHEGTKSLLNCFDADGRSATSISRSTDPTILRSDFVPSSLRGEEFVRTLRLPVPMLDSKVFLKLLQLDLQQNPPPAPITKVVLAAEAVRPQIAQHGLFQAATPAPEKLQLMLARLAGIVGTENVGSPQLLDTHAPGAFKMRAFAQNDAASGMGRRSSARNAAQHRRRDAEQSDNNESAVQFGSSSMPTRVFRPPLAATVTLRDGYPTHLSCAPRDPRDKTALAGDITWAAGPWRSSGDWWEEAQARSSVPRWEECGAADAPAKKPETKHSFARDEWDIAVAAPSGTVLCRLVHELDRAQWFVEGMYD